MNRPAQRAAAIDFGSNTVGYMVGELRDGQVRILERDSRFVRLAEGLAGTGSLQDIAVERARNWVAEFVPRLEALGVASRRAVGTAALRLASNAGEFDALMRQPLGCAIEVISGVEEAVLTYEGVRLGYPEGPLAVLDIGGGSSEVVLSDGPAAAPVAVSLPIGAVVLTERHGEDWQALQRAVNEQLAALPPAASDPVEVMVVGGNGANLAMMDQGETTLSDQRVEGHRVTRSRLTELRDRARRRSPAERIQEYGIPRRRADVLVAGMAVLEGVMDRLSISRLCASRYSLRHGVVRSLLASGSHHG